VRLFLLASFWVATWKRRNQKGLQQYFGNAQSKEKREATGRVYNRTGMRSLRSGALFLALLPLASAQTAPASAPNPDGFYEVASTNLKRLESSPKLVFPPELSAHEVADHVVVTVTIAPDGSVKTAKVISGKYRELKEAVETAVQKWAFQPYLVSGAPVPVRTELAFNFDNTLEHYRTPSGEAPVHLDEKSSSALAVKRIAPIYPLEARQNRIQGTVEFRLIIGDDGCVQFLHVIQGPPALMATAYDAVRQWQFQPYLENGKPVPVLTTVNVHFELARN
jgi:TonB family protein